MGLNDDHDHCQVQDPLPKPNPLVLDDVPYCSNTKCEAFTRRRTLDGKLTKKSPWYCAYSGARPDYVCKPAVRDMARRLEVLT